jgi:acetyltransferase-like isoleucine patch superfamily enzyme
MRINQLAIHLCEKLTRYLSGPLFLTDDVTIGKGTVIGKNVRFNCKKVVIGDGVQIGDGVVFECETLAIGDFATIYPACFFPGPGDLTIGHNFWLGSNSIIDSQGGTIIGNNVGIGAHSQLWTHMKYGDLAAGCRFHSQHQLIVEDDAWLVGHVLVSPVRIGARSIVMLGSLVVSNIPSDRVYAGSPAKDMTEKFGSQFRENTFEDRRDFVFGRIEQIATSARIRKIWSRVKLGGEYGAYAPPNELVINVVERTYIKGGTDFERLIIRSLLPDAKFVPTRQIMIGKDPFSG